MTRRLAILLLSAVVTACDRTSPPASEHLETAARAPLYQCSMHPQIVRHEPGN